MENLNCDSIAKKAPAVKPSPLPWAIAQGANGDILVTSTNEANAIDDDVALIYGGNDKDPKRAEEDAALIARAVNTHSGLVAALKEALQFMSCNCGQKCDGTCSYSEARAALRAAGEEA